MKHEPATESEAIAPPIPPPAAEAVFGDRLDLATRYAALLADTGVSHGLIGPREVPRLWERHLLNCALLTDLLPEGASVVDLGAGAGLPGITLAVRRPDLTVTLVEPLLRRVTWLQRAVDQLGLHTVQIRRARAEELGGELHEPFVTARAVAPLDRLTRWGAPLLAPGGAILAIKGRTAPEELGEHEELLGRWGIVGDVVRLGVDVVSEPTVVVRLVVPDPARVASATRRKGSGRARRRR